MKKLNGVLRLSMGGAELIDLYVMTTELFESGGQGLSLEKLTLLPNFNGRNC